MNNLPQIVQADQAITELKQGVSEALSLLKEKYSAIPNGHTKEGYAELKAGVKEVSGFRVSLEKKRKEIKAPYLDACKKIDAEAKAIESELRLIESPLALEKKAIDKAITEKKEAKKRQIEDKLNWISELPAKSITLDLAGIEENIALLDKQDFEFCVGDLELLKKAKLKKDQSMEQLCALLSQKISILNAVEAKKEAEPKAQADTTISSTALPELQTEDIIKAIAAFFSVDNASAQKMLESWIKSHSKDFPW